MVGGMNNHWYHLAWPTEDWVEMATLDTSGVREAIERGQNIFIANEITELNPAGGSYSPQRRLRDAEAQEAGYTLVTYSAREMQALPELVEQWENYKLKLLFDREGDIQSVLATLERLKATVQDIK